MPQVLEQFQAEKAPHGFHLLGLNRKDTCQIMASSNFRTAYDKNLCMVKIRGLQREFPAATVLRHLFLFTVWAVFFPQGR